MCLQYDFDKRISSNKARGNCHKGINKGEITMITHTFGARTKESL